MKKTDADNMKDVAQALTDADNTIINAENEWKEEASGIKDEAEALDLVENAAINEKEGIETFHAPKDEQLLFDQADAIVQVQNDLDNESPDEIRREHDERLAHEPREESLEAVVDEKIKEEQKKQAEQYLRNELVEGLE